MLSVVENRKGGEFPFYTSAHKSYPYRTNFCAASTNTSLHLVGSIGYFYPLAQLTSIGFRLPTGMILS